MRLGIRGGAHARAHFRAEYGDCTVSGDPPGARVEVAFEAVHRSPAGATVIRGGHKTARWAVAFRLPPAEALEASIEVGGRPRSFGLSLVQGYFVEPLLSLAAPVSGRVLLPGAALEQDGGALVILGRSRSGKTSLAVRAIAAGRKVLGDDQVLVDTSGRCFAFPRRPRVYSDLAETAPAAYGRLGATARASLAGRGLVRAASRGLVAPPLSLDRSRLGGAHAPGSLPIRRLVVIHRDDEEDALRARHLDTDRVVSRTLELLGAQRAHLPSAPAWADELLLTREREAEQLRQAFAGVAAEELRVPARWNAVRAVATLAERLDLE